MSENTHPNETKPCPLLAELIGIRRAVREHRDQIGDYRCWVDDEVLYSKVLPELVGVPPRVPSSKEFSAFCESYFDNRQDPIDASVEAIPLDSSVGPLSFTYEAELDADLVELSPESLTAQIANWRTLVRSHKDKGQVKKDYRDDQTLYFNLPEKKAACTKLPCRDQFLGKNCPAYNEYCQNNPSDYASGKWSK